MKIKKIKWLIYFIPMLFLFINIPFIRNYRQVIHPLPGKQFKKYVFNDHSDNGNSIITDFDKKNLQYSYILKNGFAFSYTGIGLRYNQPEGMDLSAYRRIRLVIRGEKIRKVKCEIKTYDREIAGTGEEFIYRYFETVIPVSGEFQTYTHDINEFKTPDWWYMDHKRQNDKQFVEKKI